VEILDFPLPDLGASAPSKTACMLLEHGRLTADTRVLVDALCRSLRAEGIPIDRAMLLLPTLHPQVRALNYIWNDGEPVREIARPWQSVDSEEFKRSPIRPLLEGTHRLVRRRIADPACARDFGILDDLAGQGFTDYVIVRVEPIMGRVVGAVSFATRQPGGFTDAQLRAALSTLPYLAPVLDTQIVRRVAGTLLNVYLGDDAGARVLDGAVRRGDGESIHAAVCFTDLRDFTVLSDRLPRTELLELLDSYFDCVVSAVHEHGGEVLKFIGDAVLAVFRASAQGEDVACRAALAAARDAFSRAEQANARRAGRQPIAFGTSIHVGEVVYGNIGGPTRLDFTVIGPAVNLASRIQGMCRPLGQPLLVSEAFVRATQLDCEDLGAQKLKGVAVDARLFAPPPSAG
jgi:adenylate cyclase